MSGQCFCADEGVRLHLARRRKFNDLVKKYREIMAENDFDATGFSLPTDLSERQRDELLKAIEDAIQKGVSFRQFAHQLAQQEFHDPSQPGGHDQ